MPALSSLKLDKNFDFLAKPVTSPLDEALIEADKGVFVSHNAVKAWVMSMGTDKELTRPVPDVFLK